MRKHVRGDFEPVGPDSIAAKSLPVNRSMFNGSSLSYSTVQRSTGTDRDDALQRLHSAITTTARRVKHSFACPLYTTCAVDEQA